MPRCEGAGDGAIALIPACAVSLSSPKQLDSVCWQRDGRLIVSCHSDGSYGQWAVCADTQQLEPVRSCVPYGQCSAPLVRAWSCCVIWDCWSLCETSSCFPVGLFCIQV